MIVFVINSRRDQSTVASLGGGWEGSWLLVVQGTLHFLSLVSCVILCSCVSVQSVFVKVHVPVAAYVCAHMNALCVSECERERERECQ